MNTEDSFMARLRRQFKFYCVPQRVIETVSYWGERPLEEVPMKLRFRWQRLPEGWISI